MDIKHTSELSRISLTEKELEKFAPQMEQILDSVKVLQDVDTKNVEAMKTHLPFSELRKDIIAESLNKEDVLSNVKHIENGMVKVYGKVFGGVEES